MPAYSLEPTANRPAGDPIEFASPFDEDDEAEVIAQRVLGAKCEHRQIAILYRTNAQSRALEDAMLRHAIPYIVHGTCGFYDRKEVKDMLAFLQLAHDPNCPAGDEAFKRVRNIPTRYFGKDTHFLGKAFIEELERDAHTQGSSLWDAVYCRKRPERQWSAINDFRQFVSSVKAAGPYVGAMIGKAREVGYDAHLTRQEGESEDGEQMDRFENLDELAHITAGYDNLAVFLGFVTQQRSQAKKLAKDQDAVQLLTLHRAKGLEFKLVCMAGVSFGLLPHRKSVEYFDANRQHIIPASIEEERRLAYVGITRAMDWLLISAPRHYQDRELSWSPFLVESGIDLPEVEAAEAAVQRQELLGL